jgi:coenzyme F420-0:L-glutamate ligase/coenzyme F420-1:gamma-L-glutamate ligase
MTPQVQIVGLTGLPEVRPGDDLVSLIVAAVRRAGLKVAPADVFVVAQKVVSKAEGRLVSLAEVTPSSLALQWARRVGRDPRIVELVLREAVRIVRMDRGVLICETAHGFVCANAGVDTSNAPPETAVLLPRDPDDSARRLAEGLRAALGCAVGVIVSDTVGRPWREGQVNVALGVAGVQPLVDYRGRRDAAGRPLEATMMAVADELAAAAELVMGKLAGVPVAWVTGVHAVAGEGTVREILRRPETDLFR